MRLPKHGFPGLLIVFEGIDGCGKGTQIELLRTKIAAEGWGDRVVESKQPGATDVGVAVRKILFHTVTTHNMEPDTASLLFLASHVQSLHDIITPALQEGRIVISDRWCAYSDTAFGLHGLKRPISPALVNVRSALGGPEPDLLFFLHGDPRTLLERAMRRTAESHESGKAWATTDRLSRIQEEYFRLFSDLAPGPLRAYCVDNQSPEQLSEQVWRDVRGQIRSHFDL